MSFYHVRCSFLLPIAYVSRCKTYPMKMQYAAFRIAEGGILHGEMLIFIAQKDKNDVMLLVPKRFILHTLIFIF